MALNTNQTTDSIAPSTTNFLVGLQARTDTTGQYTLSHSGFATAGDLQMGHIPMYVVTDLTATPTELRIGNGTLSTTPTGYLVLTDNSNYVFDCNIVARAQANPTDVCGWNLRFVTNRGTGNNTTVVAGVTKTVVFQSGDATTWDVNANADTTNGRPRILVTGQGSKTIRWAAYVTIVKVSGT